MSELDDFAPELTEFEASLSRLRPAAGRLDRDRLMFRMGQESARRRPLRLIWPAAAAVLALASAALGFQLAGRRSPQVVYVEREPAAVVVNDHPRPIARPTQQAPTTSIPSALAALELRLAGAERLRAGDLKRSALPAFPAPAVSRAVPPLAERPALRVGDRQRWREWLDESEEFDIPNGPSDKESA